MSDINVTIKDAQPINVTIESPQIIDITVDNAEPIEITVNPQAINVTIEDAQPMNVTIDGGVSNNYLNEDVKFAFNGLDGDTYLIYDSASSKLQLYVNGVKRAQWL